MTRTGIVHSIVPQPANQMGNPFPTPPQDLAKSPSPKSYVINVEFASPEGLSPATSVLGFPATIEEARSVKVGDALSLG